MKVKAEREISMTENVKQLTEISVDILIFDRKFVWMSVRSTLCRKGLQGLCATVKGFVLD